MAVLLTRLRAREAPERVPVLAKELGWSIDMTQHTLDVLEAAGKVSYEIQRTQTSKQRKRGYVTKMRLYSAIEGTGGDVRMYWVHAVRTMKTAQGYNLVSQLPTFYVEAATAAMAIRTAREVLVPDPPIRQYVSIAAANEAGDYASVVWNVTEDQQTEPGAAMEYLAVTKEHPEEIKALFWLSVWRWKSLRDKSMEAAVHRAAAFARAERVFGVPTVRDDYGDRVYPILRSRQEEK